MSCPNKLWYKEIKSRQRISQVHFHEWIWSFQFWYLLFSLLSKKYTPLYNSRDLIFMYVQSCPDVSDLTLMIFVIFLPRNRNIWKFSEISLRLHRCWWRMLETKCVGDGFGNSGHQHPLSFYIIVGHQHSKDVTNITVGVSVVE